MFRIAKAPAMLLALALSGASLNAQQAGSSLRDAATVMVAAGSGHFCALDSDGAVSCWGDGSWGQLGNGSTLQNSATPVRIASSEHFRQVVAGATHSCGLNDKGDVLCWGADVGGVFGEARVTETCGTRQCSTRPVAVVTGFSFDSIAAGFEHMCGISKGQVYCWGRGDSGQLGQVRTLGTCEEVLCSRVPVLVSDSVRFSAISVRGTHSCGISGRTVMCWGDNSIQQSGNGALVQSSFVPAQINARADYLQVSSGSRYSCATTMQGNVDCWGENNSGRLGAPDTSAHFTTVKAPANDRFVNVSVGGTHTCAVTSGGAAYCWGLAVNGRLGGRASGDCAGFACSAVPVRVPMPDKLTRIAAGGASTCAVTSAGAVYCWGGRATSVVAVERAQR